jgi:hypothetical protein
VARQQSIATETSTTQHKKQPNDNRKRRIQDTTRMTRTTTPSENVDSAYNSDSWASSFFPTEEDVDVLDDHSCFEDGTIPATEPALPLDSEPRG